MSFESKTRAKTKNSKENKTKTKTLKQQREEIEKQESAKEGQMQINVVEKILTEHERDTKKQQYK